MARLPEGAPPPMEDVSLDTGHLPEVEPREQARSRPRPRRGRLADELSPHLRRHADDPIGWHPWGPEAFETARREDRPIFLSIGSSSCHWCHVMGRECFADPEVAELMDDACVPIMLDREERPDLGALFMDACHIQNGSGGWPLTAFLTPDGRPFFVTTWLPKRTTGEFPGLTDILPRVKWLWLMQKDDVLRAAEELASVMRARASFPGGGRVGAAPAREAMDALRRAFDPEWGGFGKAPKRPEAPKLLFLLQQASSPLCAQQERDEAFAMVDLTLRRMWRGGIHDHLGGGFARCSTDGRWLVPHFEKLLSDQAMMLLLSALAQERKADPFWAILAEDIIGCVTRDFADPSQCFRTAIDSDTIEGEGRSYTWRDEEIRALLPTGDAGLFCAAYAVMPGGNFGHEMGGSHIGHNILYEATTVADLARRYGLHGPDVARRLATDREILREARGRRALPMCDDKILMDWNGLMIGALARASSAFERPEWREVAERAALALQKALPDPKGKWRRRIRGGTAGIGALAGDFAALLWGVMEVHRAATKAEAGEKQLASWLKYASALAEAMMETCWDEEGGGLSLELADDPCVFLRRCSARDDDLPSANALAALALSALGAATGEKAWADAARKILSRFARVAAADPVGHATLLSAAVLWRPVRPKPKEPPRPAPKDEELLAHEEPMAPRDEPQDEPQEAPRRGARSSRQDRAARQERRAGRAQRSARPRGRG